MAQSETLVEQIKELQKRVFPEGTLLGWDDSTIDLGGVDLTDNGTTIYDSEEQALGSMVGAGLSFSRVYGRLTDEIWQDVLDEDIDPPIHRLGLCTRLESNDRVSVSEGVEHGPGRAYLEAGDYDPDSDLENVMGSVSLEDEGAVSGWVGLGSVVAYDGAVYAGVIEAENDGSFGDWGLYQIDLGNFEYIDYSDHGSAIYDLTVYKDHVWYINESELGATETDTLYRVWRYHIDAEEDDVPAYTTLSSYEGGLVVGREEGELTKYDVIDDETQEVDTVTLDAQDDEDTVSGIDFDGGMMYVSTTSGEVFKLDPNTFEVVDKTEVEKYADGDLAVLDGWGIVGGGQWDGIEQFDAEEMVATGVSDDLDYNGSGSTLTSHEKYIYVGGFNKTHHKVDPETVELVDTHLNSEGPEIRGIFADETGVFTADNAGDVYRWGEIGPGATEGVVEHDAVDVGTVPDRAIGKVDTDQLPEGSTVEFELIDSDGNQQRLDLDELDEGVFLPEFTSPKIRTRAYLDREDGTEDGPEISGWITSFD